MSNFLSFIILLIAGWINRLQVAQIEYLKEEVRVLREHIPEGRIKFTDAQRRRLATKAKAVGRKGLKDLSGLATPDTLLRWFQRLVAKKYDGSAKRGLGRPRLRDRIADLVLKMAEENLSWGYTRIRDALHNLGITTDRNTVKRILNDHGIEPAPERKRKMPWSTFIAAQLDALAAMDFFNVEVLTFTGIIRYHVLFAIHLKTREVQIVGIKSNPSEEWMKQMARNLTDCYDSFLKDMHYVIMDRDPLYTPCFRKMLGDTGTKPLRLPRRSPDSVCERFVLSIKSECLDKIIPLGERHLRKAIKEFIVHYHAERNHQGLDSVIIHPDEHVGVGEGTIKTRSRLGGLLNYYYREAA